MRTTRGLYTAIMAIALAAGCDENAAAEGGGGGATEGEAGAGGDDGAATGDACEDRPGGQYANCMGADPAAGSPQFDVSVCGSGDAVCVTDRPQKPSAGVCSFGTCESECECPAPPETGDATPTCGPIIPEGEPQCYLDCSQGQLCPNDMFCWGGFVCAWSAEAGGTPYGDCMNAEVEEACGVTQHCVLDDQMAPTYGVCAEMGCMDVSQCPSPPGSGNAVLTCAPIVYGSDNACYLDCSEGETCPDGMVCFGEVACAWEDGMPADGGGGTTGG